MSRLRGLLKKRTDSNLGSDKTVYINVMSESTLSTSSMACAVHPETHELDALAYQPNR